MEIPRTSALRIDKRLRSDQGGIEVAPATEQLLIKSRSFLAATTAAAVVPEASRPPSPVLPVTELPALAAGTRREEAVVQVLRGLADLIES